MDATCAMLIKSHEQVLNIIVEDKSAVHMLNVAGGRGRGVPGSLTDTLLGCRLQWPRCRCL